VTVNHHLSIKSSQRRRLEALNTGDMAGYKIESDTVRIGTTELLDVLSDIPDIPEVTPVNGSIKLALLSKVISQLTEYKNNLADGNGKRQLSELIDDIPYNLDPPK